MNQPHISIVSPVFKAKSIVTELVSQIEQNVLKITQDFEIILVDDGCPENSWFEIEKIAEINPNVIGVKLSRNFGQHYAISAGIAEARGTWMVVMDCDLQDDPKEIPNLYNECLKGYDIVLAQRIARKDRYIKKFFSKIFYKALSYLTGVEQDETIANFGIYHRKVIDQITHLNDSIRFFPGMVKWVGFTTQKLPVDHANRASGESSYNFKKIFKLAVEIILAYSDKPIRIVIKLGFFISLISLFIAIYFGYKNYIGQIAVSGFTSLIVSIWLLSGVIISILGMIGLYIGKIFEQSKNRPSFIIQKRTND